MIRTVRAPIRDKKVPSSSLAITGSRRVEVSRARNWALVAATASRKAAASNPRSVSTSMSRVSRCSSCRA